MRKQWKYKSFNQQTVNQLVEGLDISQKMAILMVHRGIHTIDQAERYFNPTFEHLHDPFLFKDMDKGVKRLAQAIEKDEQILLYGDYDVDGVTSVTLLYLFLKRFTNQLDYYIPDRYKEGYGLTTQGVDFAKQNRVKLIIAMDCGTSALESIQLAKEKGIDVIVLDHHLPGTSLPATVALINTKQSDCPYPFKELSGCGVTFKFAQAYAKYKDIPARALVPLLDLVAISIACDYVLIEDENRVLATLGLAQMNKNARVGLKALITKTNYTYPFTISDIVFGIGPYINAAGRLSDGKEAVRLLLAEDWLVATEYANILRKRNDQRRIFDKQNLDEAIKTWEQTDHQDIPIIFLFQSDWHKGVLGIVASRMSKHYHKPAIIMCESNGEIVASARSTATINVRELLTKSAHLFNSFGGHPSAAGFTMNPEHLTTLSENLHVAMKEVSILKQTPVLNIDVPLELSDITPNFLSNLNKLQPFGPGNPNPLFVCEKVEVAGPIRYVVGTNLKLLVQKENSGIFKAVGFRKGDFVGQIDSPYFSMCYKIIENVWRGKKTIQLQLKDVVEGEVVFVKDLVNTNINL